MEASAAIGSFACGIVTLVIAFSSQTDDFGALKPAFWPLVPRHTDHLGLQNPSSVGGASKARADCTHWRPSSPAMGVLNALLLDALSRLPQPLA